MRKHIPLKMAAFSEGERMADRISWKTGVIRARKLYEGTAQVPSPSKDFCQILITEKGVVWRKWKITLRNYSHGVAPLPTEQVMTYDDYRFDKSLQFEIETIFGVKTLRQTLRIVEGCNDHLSSLPEPLALNVICYLDLQSITFLSQVNQHFRELCNADSLWERLYAIHQGPPNIEIKALAKEMGWKEVFFMNKLHLQKEISRKRRQLLSSQSDSGGATFVTQQVED